MQWHSLIIKRACRGGQVGCTPLATSLHLGSSYAALFGCARLQGCISGGTMGCGPPLLHPPTWWCGPAPWHALPPLTGLPPLTSGPSCALWGGVSTSCWSDWCRLWGSFHRESCRLHQFFAVPGLGPSLWPVTVAVCSVVGSMFGFPVGWESQYRSDC